MKALTPPSLPLSLTQPCSLQHWCMYLSLMWRSTIFFNSAREAKGLIAPEEVVSKRALNSSVTHPPSPSVLPLLSNFLFFFYVRNLFWTISLDLSTSLFPSYIRRRPKLRRQHPRTRILLYLRVRSKKERKKRKRPFRLRRCMFCTHKEIAPTKEGERERDGKWDWVRERKR